MEEAQGLIGLFRKLYGRNWRPAAILVILILIFGVIYLLFENRNKELQVQHLQSENKRVRDQLNSTNALGVKEEPVPVEQNIADFNRDWDTNDFYQKNADTFCPSRKGGNNYQRIFYKSEIPLLGTKLNLKYRMIDEEGKDYEQRMIVGLGKRKGLLSELDIPTRLAPVVNFREYISGVDSTSSAGQSLSSPVKEGSVINLNFETKMKIGSEITEVANLEYISENPEFGDENKDVTYDLKTGDAKPESYTTSLFIGSYIGGCIQIIDWSIT